MLASPPYTDMHMVSSARVLTCRNLSNETGVVDAGNRQLDIFHISGSGLSAGQRKRRYWDLRLASGGRGATSDTGVRYSCLEILLSLPMPVWSVGIRALRGRAACTRNQM